MYLMRSARWFTWGCFHVHAHTIQTHRFMPRIAWMSGTKVVRVNTLVKTRRT